MRGSAHDVCGSIERMMGSEMVEYTSVYLLISIDLGSTRQNISPTSIVVSSEGLLHYFCLV